jgi:biopolymer transport protein ExbD
MIKADAGTRTAEVVYVLRAARMAGMENVKIATQLASAQ